MEGESHDSVSEIESLLDTVAVVDVDINVQHSGIMTEEFTDRDHNIIDEAEPTGLRLLGVVEAAGPVDGDWKGIELK